MRTIEIENLRRSKYMDGKGILQIQDVDIDQVLIDALDENKYKEAFADFRNQFKSVQGSGVIGKQSSLAIDVTDYTPNCCTFYEEDDETIGIVSMDNDNFIVSKKYLSNSLQLADDLIQLPIRSIVLEKVFSYCQYHYNNQAKPIPKPLAGTLNDHICEWDQNYLDIDSNILMEIIEASNMLDLTDLLEVSCAKIAFMVEAKSYDQVKEMFFGTTAVETNGCIKEEKEWNECKKHFDTCK